MRIKITLCFESIQKPSLPIIPYHSRKVSAVNYFDTAEQDIDDDGNPLTVPAAIRIFHKQEGTNRIFCAQ